jgi:hypothetical protein
MRSIGLEMSSHILRGENKYWIMIRILYQKSNSTLLTDTTGTEQCDRMAGSGGKEGEPVLDGEWNSKSYLDTFKIIFMETLLFCRSNQFFILLMD